MMTRKLTAVECESRAQLFIEASMAVDNYESAGEDWEELAKQKPFVVEVLERHARYWLGKKNESQRV